MDFQSIGAAAAKVEGGSGIVKGRVVQHDADISCYDFAWPDDSLNSNWKAMLKAFAQIRRDTNSEFINLHVTMGLKNGRNNMATVKEYQAGRGDRDPEKQKRVWELRNKIANHSTEITCAVVWLYIEADDGMIQYQEAAIAHGEGHLSIINSGDKDLWMGMGLHKCQYTGAIYEVTGYDTTAYKEVGNAKPKLLGRGRSWFWHQMIMGDKADDIPGLPMISGPLAERYLPLKKANPNRNALKCGEAKAVAILKGVTTDKEALKRVCEAYHAHYGAKGYEMMFEQAYLLWMQRSDNLLDVLDYWRDLCGFTYRLTSPQKAALSQYMSLVQTRKADASTSES